MSNNNFEIQHITFEQIQSIWKENLWPSRETNEIKTHSSMKFMQGYDMKIYESIATYFSIVNNGKIVAVNSGFQTAKYEYRSRGLFVFPEYRKRGIGKQILLATIEQAVKERSRLIWSFPRTNSLQTYQSVGFVQCSEIIYEDVISGPNCYVKLEL